MNTTYSLAGFLKAIEPIVSNDKLFNFVKTPSKKSISLYFYQNQEDRKDLFNVSVDFDNRSEYCGLVDLSDEKFNKLEEMIEEYETYTEMRKQLDVSKRTKKSLSIEYNHCNLKDPSFNHRLKNKNSAVTVHCKYPNKEQ